MGIKIESNAGGSLTILPSTRAVDEIFVIDAVDNGLDVSHFNGLTTESFLSTTNSSAGIISMPNMPYFQGALNGDEGSNYYQAISEEFSNNFIHDANSITVQKPGNYMIEVGQMYSSGGAVYLRIVVNDIRIKHGYDPSPYYKDISVSSLLSLNTGDVIKFFVEGTPSEAWDGQHSNISIFMVH